MDRRAFLGSLAFEILGAPRRTFARPAGKIHRIGILSHPSRRPIWLGPQPRSPYAGARLRGLRELGYVYGEHFVTEPRGGEGRPERPPETAERPYRVRAARRLTARGLCYTSSSPPRSETETESTGGRARQPCQSAFEPA
jgi:hypothetical protein